jgi:hypothetical protein
MTDEEKIALKVACLRAGRGFSIPGPICARIPEIPCKLPASREFGFRDGFARDCLLQRGVGCELDFLNHGRHGLRYLGRFIVEETRSRGWD